MKTLHLTIATGLCLILWPFSIANGAPCGGDIDEKPKLQHIDEMLANGQNQRALHLLELISAPDDPDSADRLWRLARVYYERGRLETNNAAQLLKKSEDFARTAIKRAPDCSDGYKWLAIALGAQMKYLDMQTRVRQSREIKENIDKAIELDPEDDISYLVLSRWHYKLSGLGIVARTFARIIYGGIPDASLAEAEKLLLQAIALRDRISHRYNLAKVYKRMERQEDAVEQLKLALLLPVTFPEEAEELEKSREKLEE
jgi:tetratricopeptide (TPR) repeat protein